MKGGNFDNVTILNITPRVIPTGLHQQMYDHSKVGNQKVGYVNTQMHVGGKNSKTIKTKNPKILNSNDKDNKNKDNKNKTTQKKTNLKNTKTTNSNKKI